jgi:hypothetical protein
MERRLVVAISWGVSGPGVSALGRGRGMSEAEVQAEMNARMSAAALASHQQEGGAPVMVLAFEALDRLNAKLLTLQMDLAELATTAMGPEVPVPRNEPEGLHVPAGKDPGLVSSRREILARLVGQAEVLVDQAHGSVRRLREFV